jgi:hypothetical protein
MMKAPENKAATAASAAETCPYCGRPLSLGLCRPERLGFYCWADGLKIAPGDLHLPDDTTPEHARRARARFDKQIEEASVREREAAESAELADLAWWAPTLELNKLAASDSVRMTNWGEMVPETPEVQAKMDALKASIPSLFAAREDAYEGLKRARIELHKLQHARTHAGCRAEVFGPGVVDKLRDAIGL